VQVSYNHPTEEGSRIKVEKHFLLSSSDIGRRSSRDAALQINKYLERSKDSVSVSLGSSVTVVGVLMIVGGLVSAVLSLLMGQWSDPEPKRMKKAK
jgi:hypothetical protein